MLLTVMVDGHAPAASRSQGERTGNIAFGYRLAADGKHLEPDAPEQAVLAEVRRLRSGGATLRGIAATLNGQALTTHRGTAWDCYSDLMLWAAYSEHHELVRPGDSVEDFGHDPAYVRSTATDFRSRYSHLLEVEWWLPCDFKFVFQAEKVGDGPVLIGSSVALLRQLKDLNSRTWRSDLDLLGAWRREGSEHGAPLESGARFAFALL
jgi:hypothetical protein